MNLKKFANLLKKNLNVETVRVLQKVRELEKNHEFENSSRI